MTPSLNRASNEMDAGIRWKRLPEKWVRPGPLYGTLRGGQVGLFFSGSASLFPWEGHLLRTRCKSEDDDKTRACETDCTIMPLAMRTGQANHGRSWRWRMPPSPDSDPDGTSGKLVPVGAPNKDWVGAYRGGLQLPPQAPSAPVLQ